MILLAIGQAPREISACRLSALRFGESDLAYLQNIRNTPSLCRSVGCRKLLEMLCTQANLPRTSLRIERDEYNRPFLFDLSHADFNFSHANHLCASALILSSAEKPTPRIGLDLEHVSYHDRTKRLAQRIFSPSEQEDYAQNGEESFYRIWTQKEAFAKYSGIGVSQMLHPRDTVAEATKMGLFLHTQRITQEKDVYYLTVCTEEKNMPHIQWQEITCE